MKYSETVDILLASHRTHTHGSHFQKCITLTEND